MTVYNTNPDQCELHINFQNLLYVIGLNITIIFIPVVVLVALYITIIIKSWNNYRNHIKICSFSKISSFKGEKNRFKLLYETYNLKNSNNNIISTLSSENCLNLNLVNGNNEIIRLRPSISTNNSNNIEIGKNHLSSHGSLFSLDNIMKEKAKKEFKSIFKLSTVTILAFFLQLPRRVFLCWSYLNSYWSIFDNGYFEDFFEQYNDSINPIFFINVINLVYLMYLIFNSIIYNLFSCKFRSTLKKMLN
jgi:hypothetical protein